MQESTFQPAQGRARFGRRTRISAAALLVAATAGVALVATVFAGGATAQATATAMENIDNARVGIAYSGSDSPDASWTNLGTLGSLTPGDAYVVLANVQLKSNATVPAAAVCGLSITNEPTDYQTATFTPGSGSDYATLSFEGATLLRGVGFSPVSGSASLLCHVTGPGTSKLVLAHEARIVDIPVDSATSNLHTYGS